MKKYFLAIFFSTFLFPIAAKALSFEDVGTVLYDCFEPFQLIWRPFPLAIALSLAWFLIIWINRKKVSLTILASGIVSFAFSFIIGFIGKKTIENTDCNSFVVTNILWFAYPLVFILTLVTFLLWLRHSGKRIFKFGLYFWSLVFLASNIAAAIFAIYKTFISR